MNILLTIQSAQSDRPGAYRTDITITSGNSITTYLFVKERIIDADGNADDTFVAVASPAQIEDIPQSTPLSPSSYFRDNTVSLISSDPGYLETVVQDILDDLNLTVTQSNELTTFTNSHTYTVDAVNGVTITS